MNNQISISQFFIIFLLSTGLINHVLVIPLIIDVAGRDAWISAIIGFFMIIPFLCLLLYVTKRFNNVSMFEWLETNYSIVLRRAVAMLLVVFLFITGFITLKETVTWTHNTYLLNTPIMAIGFSILIVSLYISYEKINVIAICAGVLIPFVIIFEVFVTVGTIPDKNYSLILPVLIQNGWVDVMKGSIFVFGSLIEIFLLLMIQHEVAKKVKFRHLILLSLFLFFLTLSPLIGSIAIFGTEEAGRITYPAFMQWRILSIGQYFNHLDFLSIYQWLSGSFIRLALIMYLITKTFKLKEKRQHIIIQTVVCIFYLLLILLPISDEQFSLFLSRYFYLATSIFGIMMTVFLAFLIKKSMNGMSAHEK
ncbi:endospore germination permease [Ornithinibacillus salinisoli]|uniref:Endospore germination permease n=1 Tax=Ornithinibacillus salinisoli TaxID=1848459 RepID=A0ABW4W7D8_9BACI